MVVMEGGEGIKVCTKKGKEIYLEEWTAPCFIALLADLMRKMIDPPQLTGLSAGSLRWCDKNHPKDPLMQ
jgi:hypothetical protein